MTCKDPNRFTQVVLSSDSSAVKYVGDWQQNPAERSFDIMHPSGPASVALTFEGVQARVFGDMSFNDDPLRGSIAGVSGFSSNFNFTYHPCHHSDDDRRRDQGSTPFYVTNRLPCDKYTLNLTVGPNQAMQVQQFKFTPCLPGSGTAASVPNNNSSSSSSSSSINSSSSGSSPSGLSAVSGAEAGRKPLTAALIAILVLCSVLVFFALGGLVLVLLRMRRQRKRRGQRSLFCSHPWLRLPSHRPKLSPSAQYLASVADADTGSSGGGRDAESGPRGGTAARAAMKMSRMFGSSASGSRAALLVPFQVTVESTSSPPWWEAKGVEKKKTKLPRPPQALDDGDSSDGSVDGGRVVRGYLSDSKELTASQVHPQLEHGGSGGGGGGGGVLGPLLTSNSDRSDPPQYEFHAL